MAKRIKLGRAVFGKVGTLSGRTLYRKGTSSSLGIMDGKGKKRRFVALAKYI